MKFLLKLFLTVLAVLAVPHLVSSARADIPMSEFADSVSIGASFDTTYQYVFNCDKEAVKGDCPKERGLYPEHNDFSIDAFTLSLEKKADFSGASLMDKVGFRTDILFGEQAERLGFGFNSNGDGSVSPYQAYISIAPAERISITAGQFTTLAGWELIEAKNNTNISRSLLFYRIPFAHTGARISYDAGPATLTLGISNDWDALDDKNDGKTFEAQASYSRSSDSGLVNDLWLGATVYVGSSQFLETSIEDKKSDENGIQTQLYMRNGEQLPNMTTLRDGRNNVRTLVTLVGSVTSGKFTFVGDSEFTWVQDGKASLRRTVTTGENPQIRPVGVKYDTFFRWGVGGYFIYEANPKTKLSLRAEYVDDSDTGSGVKLFEVTPTVSWKPFGESEKGTLETRLEYRWDRADKKYFNDDRRKGPDKKDQHAVLFQLLYWI